MKNLVLTSILILTSLISFSQKNFTFMNENVIYYESIEKFNVNQTLSDKKTIFFPESESYGIYNINLTTKKLSLNYLGEDYSWNILESILEDGFLFVKVFEGLDDKKRDMIATYRLSLNDQEDIKFVYQTYDYDNNFTWGIASKEIKNLLCK